MIDKNTFNLIHNRLDVEGHNISVIFSDRRPATLYGRETGHFSAVLPRVKDREKTAVGHGVSLPSAAGVEKSFNSFAYYSWAKDLARCSAIYSPSRTT